MSKNSPRTQPGLRRHVVSAAAVALCAGLCGGAGAMGSVNGGNGRDTILGSDNKAAVVAMLEAARELPELAAIRRAETEGVFRSNELSDFEDWDVLSPEELQEVEAARTSGQLFPLNDPRQLPTFVRSGSVWLALA